VPSAVTPPSTDDQRQVTERLLANFLGRGRTATQPAMITAAQAAIASREIN
jgi:hypothetical protein